MEGGGEREDDWISRTNVTKSIVIASYSLASSAENAYPFVDLSASNIQLHNWPPLKIDWRTITAANEYYKRPIP